MSEQSGLALADERGIEKQHRVCRRRLDLLVCFPESDLVCGADHPSSSALRALGIAREDRALLEQAAVRFEAMDCDWHAGETRRLLA